MSGLITLPDEVIIQNIFLIRGHKVMIDRDLAVLYGLETKKLKQAVRRNSARFPEDFMFEMSEEEFQNWRSQFVTSNSEKMGLRYPPFCFTEQGVTMLSCILKTPRAIEVNIRIIRIFTKLREMVMAHKDILLKLEQIEKQVIRHDDEIKKIFTVLKQLLTPPPPLPPRVQVSGYKLKKGE